MPGTRVLDQGRPPARLSVQSDPISLTSPRLEIRARLNIYVEREQAKERKKERERGRGRKKERISEAPHYDAPYRCREWRHHPR